MMTIGQHWQEPIYHVRALRKMLDFRYLSGSNEVRQNGRHLLLLPAHWSSASSHLPSLSVNRAHCEIHDQRSDCNSDSSHRTAGDHYTQRALLVGREPTHAPQVRPHENTRTSKTEHAQHAAMCKQPYASVALPGRPNLNAPAVADRLLLQQHRWAERYRTTRFRWAGRSLALATLYTNIVAR